MNEYPKLDPEPWHDPRPGTSLTRGAGIWGHAQFDPRPEYSQNPADYAFQNEAVERGFYTAHEYEQLKEEVAFLKNWRAANAEA